MRSELSVGLIKSSTILCVRVHASDAGRSRVADVSDMFAGLFKLPASFCMSGTSVSSLGLSGSLMHGTAPLTGKSGLSNVFAGVLESSPTLCTCMRTLCMHGQLSSPSVSLGHGFVLPEGESGGFEFAGCALILSCVSPAIFTCSATPCMSVRRFGMPTCLLGSTLLQRCAALRIWKVNLEFPTCL